MCKATPQQPVCYKMAYATSWPQRPRGQTQHLCSGTPAGPGPGFAGRARGRQPAAQHARCMMPCWCMVQLGVRHAPSASQRRCITRSCLPDSAACSVALAAPAGPQGHGSDPPQCGYPSARRPPHHEWTSRLGSGARQTAGPQGATARQGGQREMLRLAAAPAAAARARRAPAACPAPLPPPR